MATTIGELRETGVGVEIEWRIPDFSLPEEGDDCSYKNSPAFYFSGSSWYLRIYPNGHSENNTIGWIGVYLLRGNSGAPVTLTYALGLKTAEDKKERTFDFTDVFVEKDSGYGPRRFLSRLELVGRKSQLAPSDVFTVICSLKDDDPKDVGISVPVIQPPIVNAKNRCVIPKLFTSVAQLFTTFSEYFWGQKDLNNFQCRLHSEGRTCLLLPSDTHPTACKIGELSKIRGELEVEWKIPNVSSLSEAENACYCSPDFYFAGTSWYLEIFPNGETDDDTTEWVRLYLMKGTSASPVTLTYAFGLKRLDGHKEKQSDSTDVFGEDNYGFGTVEFISRSDLMERKFELAPSDVLTVICSLREDDPEDLGCAKEPEKADAEKEERGRTEKLLVDLKRLMHNGEHSDLTITVKGEQFPAHRSILEARAPNFLSMSQHQMEETTKQLISINEFEADALRPFLLYVYTGTVEEDISPKTLISLYKMADKYQVSDLKRGCLDRMKNTMSIDMFFDIISLSQTHNETGLTEQTADFFCDKTKDIVSTEQWQTFMCENASQANEMFMKAVLNKQYECL